MLKFRPPKLWPAPLRILSGWSTAGPAPTVSPPLTRSASTINPFRQRQFDSAPPRTATQRRRNHPNPRRTSRLRPPRPSRRHHENPGLPHRSNRHPGRSLATRRRPGQPLRTQRRLSHSRLLRRPRRQDASHRRPQPEIRNHSGRTSSPPRPPAAKSASVKICCSRIRSPQQLTFKSSPPTRNISR